MLTTLSWTYLVLVAVPLGLIALAFQPVRAVRQALVLRSHAGLPHEPDQPELQVGGKQVGVNLPSEPDQPELEIDVLQLHAVLAAQSLAATPPTTPPPTPRVASRPSAKRVSPWWALVPWLAPFGSAALLIGGLLLRDHYEPIRELCSTGLGALGQAVDQGVQQDCSLDSALADVGTILVVVGGLFILGSAFGLIVAGYERFRGQRPG